MAEPLADAGDVAALFGDLSSVPSGRVDALCAYASALARAKAPGVDGRIVSGEVDEQTVRGVVATAVARALRNPQGVKSETTGPFSVSYDSQVSAGYVFFTDDEVALLGAGAVGRPRFGTLVVGPRW